jgi:DNA processing protein
VTIGVAREESAAADLGVGVDEPTEAETWAILMWSDGLGPAGFAGLLGAYGTARNVVAAAARRGAAASFSAIVAAAQGRRIPDPAVGQGIVAAARMLDEAVVRLRAARLQVVTLDDPSYPSRLRSIDLPPPVLLVRGDAAILSARVTVAVVGTRRPSERGRIVAARIAGAIAERGGVVVSGLAVGIDGAAHAAVVAAERPTIAVLGSGHDRLYPRAHVRLADDLLAAGGVLVSELAPDRAPTPGTFPQRNRVISGLSDVTIVVEAGVRSGALITADWALAQGRDCYIVPGSIDDPRSAGCLAWYREFPDVVRLVTGVPELLVDLGLDDAAADDHAALVRGGSIRPPGVRGRPSLAAELVELGATAREVGLALVAGHGSIDDLVSATGHAPATVLGAITLLESRGLATSTYGRYRPAGRLASANGAEDRSGRRNRCPRVATRTGRPHTGGLPGREPPC